jgi:hypothetical protein
MDLPLETNDLILEPSSGMITGIKDRQDQSKHSYCGKQISLISWV